MENPLKSIELKSWPDFVLAIAVFALITSIAAMYSGIELAKILSIGFGGFVLFGVAGKIAYFKYRDPNIKGNANAWFPGWRHSILADCFAVSGLVLVGVSAWLIVKNIC